MFKKISIFLLCVVMSSLALSTDLTINVDYDSYDAIKDHSSAINPEVENNFPFHLDTFTQLKEGQTHFQYYAYSLEISSSFKTFLILEDYDFESGTWLATYTLDGEFIDAIEIYSDNDEGCQTANSTIDTSKIEIQVRRYDCNMSDDENTRNVTGYTISQEGRIVPL